MHPTPLAIQIERVQRDRPIRNIVFLAVFLVSQAFHPLLLGFYLIGWAFVVDTAAFFVEKRLLRRRSYRLYLGFCGLNFIYTSLVTILSVQTMFAGEIVSFIYGHAILWVAIVHCVVLRTDKGLLHMACVLPLVVGILSTVGALPGMGASRFDVVACGAIAILLALYLSTIVRSSILQKQDLHRANRTASEALRTKERFFAAVGHEIRTPLNGVLGIAQILEAEAEHPCEKDRARILAMSCTNLRVLIDDMLDHAKLSEGKFTLAPKPVVTADLVDAVRGLYHDSAIQKGLILRAEFVGSNPACIEVDDVRVRQILCNLVSNALKYTDEGEIVLTVSTHYRRDAPWLSVAVRDTGTGIPRDKLATIFEPYHQLEDTPSRAGVGTGLGLVIARDLARFMGGDVSVASEYGHGTEFTLNIPAPVASLPDEGASDRVPDLSGLTILVADDTRMNRMIVRKFLEPTLATVVEAEDGREALDLMRSSPVDLVILDMQMPRLDGAATLDAIRADPRLRAVRAVLLTAGDRDSEAGAFDGRLAKPLDRGDLLSLLRALLPAPDLRRSA